MDDETRAQIEHASREEDIARAYHNEKELTLYQVIRDILAAKRATPEELAAFVPFRVERVRQIGRGQWYRTGGQWRRTRTIDKPKPVL